MSILNLGILAHIDAGKTTLTEALLRQAGLVDAVGNVEDGTTHTDSMDLERARGITIRAAAVSVTMGDSTLNIVDTPGHPDFIAEVERSLAVLDGAVLVVSAVEGVQAQTVVLYRALRRLNVPTIFFVNKIDRFGADPDRVIQRIRERLSEDLVVMNRAEDVGTKRARVQQFSLDDHAHGERVANVLAMHDDNLLEAIVDQPDAATAARLSHALQTASAQGRVHPVYVGAAVIDTGVQALLDAVFTLLPPAAGTESGPLSGLVFKVDRDAGGGQIAFARIFDGVLALRDWVEIEGKPTKITSIDVLTDGSSTVSSTVGPGMIAVLRGLKGVRIGDALGAKPGRAVERVFPSPSLEAAIVAKLSTDNTRLHAALLQLAERDPLINLRQDDVLQEMYVSLYGEVQKEVLMHTLESEYGVAVTFRETTVIHRETPRGVGTAELELGSESNPFLATMGLRVEPGPPGSGITFEVEAEVGSLPIYLFKTMGSFTEAMHRYISAPLRQGLHGWQVDDCLVTLTTCDYMAPGTGASDYRKLAPLVVMSALRDADTIVLEPVDAFTLEAPSLNRSTLMAALGQARAIPSQVDVHGSELTVMGTIPVAEVHHLQTRLAALTHGEGVLEVTFDRFAPTTGSAPTRARTGPNPLKPKEYLSHAKQ